MPEVREVFEMVAKQTEPDLDAWSEQERRQRRSTRDRKLGAFATTAAVLVVAVLVGIRFLGHDEGGGIVGPSGLTLDRGTVVTVVGTGEGGNGGVGGPATKAELFEPVDIAFDPAGNMYIAERYGSRVLKVDTTGTLTLAAGAGTGFSGDGGPAIEAELSGASGVAVDGEGNLYISEVFNHRIRMVDQDGTITTVVGTGDRGFSGDGGPATQAQIDTPLGMAVDAAGNVYFVDSGNFVVRMVNTNGTITTVAGTGEPGSSPIADRTPATEARLGAGDDHMPLGLAFDDAGRLFMTDFARTLIWLIDQDGRLQAVAGNGEPEFSGDGGTATSAGISQPTDIAIGPDGRLFIATHDHGVEGERIRMVAQDGTITTIAGIGASGYSGDGGPATEAAFNIPSGIAVGPDGNLYVADAVNNVIRMVVL